MADILGVRSNRVSGSGAKLYVLNGTDWDDFSNQPGSTQFGLGLWGGPYSTIWAYSEATPTNKYLFFNGIDTWTEHDPPTSVAPDCIHGSDDGLHVYATGLTGGTSELHKWDGASWSLLHSGHPKFRCVWCDATGQYVWLTPGLAVGGQVAAIYYSDDYGATFSNLWSAALADLGLTGISGTVSPGCIWGVSATELYMQFGYGAGASPPALSSAGGGIATYDGADWSWAAQTSGSNYQMSQPSSTWANDAGKAVCDGTNISSYIPYTHRKSGSAIAIVITPADSPSREYGRAIVGDGNTVVSTYRGRTSPAAQSQQWVSTDGGDTWAQTTNPWSGETLGVGGSVEGLGAVTVYGWLETDPYIEDEDPAPDSVNNAADTGVAMDIIGEGGDLDTTTVQIWINGTLAWSMSRAMAGFTGSTPTAVILPAGYRYTLQPAEPFEPGTQTVRVVAQDTSGNAVDTTYTFDTVELLVVNEDVAVEPTTAATVGLDLYLDTSHDLEVQDYDLRLVAGVDEVAQHLLVGLRLFRGEWYLDEDAGVPYYRDIFVAAPSSRVIDALFRQEILSDADIESLTSFELDINRGTRHLDLAFTAVSSVGEVEVSAVFP